jgi:hypothetical protein
MTKPAVNQRSSQFAGKLSSVSTRKFASIGTKAAAAVALVACFISAAQAQTERETRTVPAPPPLKLMSEGERKRLNDQKDVKKRTELALQLMRDRLTNAEKLNKLDEFDKMFTELGAFHAIVDDTLEFLETSDSNRRKVLNNFKRYEIGIRRLAPRLELLRRESPLEYEHYIVHLLRNVRDARSRAIEPFYSDTVVPRRPA